eukprot:scaffold47971_cov59-Phaeocystis_antarctica.AAC.1
MLEKHCRHLPLLDDAATATGSTKGRAEYATQGSNSGPAGPRQNPRREDPRPLLPATHTCGPDLLTARCSRCETPNPDPDPNPNQVCRFLAADDASPHGQGAPLAAPQPGSRASSGPAWLLWAARHSQGEAGPLGAQPLPRLLELAASNTADFTAVVHSGLAARHGLRDAHPRRRDQGREAPVAARGGGRALTLTLTLTLTLALAPKPKPKPKPNPEPNLNPNQVAAERSVAEAAEAMRAAGTGSVLEP